MTTEVREVLYRLRGDASQLDAASAAGARSLGAVDAAMDNVAAEAGRAQAATQALERQQRQSVATLRQVVQWETALANIRTSAADKQAGLTAAQGNFLRTLQQQAATAGKTRAELLGMQAAQLGVTAQAAPFIARLAGAERGVKGVAAGTKLTKQEMLALNFTMSDIAASLASGASPFTILLQQGGQVKDTFGGIGPLFTKLGALITPARLAIGGVAAAAGLLAVAYAQGYSEDKKFRDSLTLTGNRAGLTRDSFTALAEEIERSADVTIGRAREISQALVSTGQIGPAALASIGSAAAQVARLTGRSTDDVVKDFAAMAGGVAKWAAEHNRAYNYLTVEQYKYIRALEAQGRTEEAMRVNAEALDKALKDRAEQLGYLERGWRGVKEFASDAWDAMLNVGRPETLGDQVRAAEAQLATLQAAYERARGRGTGEEGGPGEPGLRRRRLTIAAVEQNLAALRAQSTGEQRVAQQAAAKAAETQKEIEREGDAFRNAELSKEGAYFAERQAQADLARERQRIATQRAYDEQMISAQAFRQRMYALDQAELADKLRAIEQEEAIERRRVPENEAGRIAQEARIVEIRTRRFAVERDLARLAEDERSGRRDPQPRNVIESPQAEFRRAELEQQQAVEEGLKTRREAASTFARDLRETNAALSTNLIRDERARGEALLALEAENLRKRMDIGALAGEERLRAEEEFSQFVLLRQAQLNEELKPEWQRMLDDWRDTTRLMKDAGDNFATGFVREGEDAFVEFAKSGKVTVKGLVDFTVAELARLQYRKLIAGSGAEGFIGSIARLFTGGGGTVSGDISPGGSYDLPAANGAAFERSAVQPFARGGILGPTGGLLSRPTLFPMANGGVGLGGEAGTEAVMPLKRGPGGRLGVEVNGGGVVPQLNVTINNTASDVVETTARQDETGQLEVTVRRIVRDENARDLSSGGGPISTGLKSRGINLSGGLPRRK